MSLDVKIVRITTGLINTVNDAAIGMSAAPLGPGVSRFSGQLGAKFWLDDSQLLYSGANPVYGGLFQYVRLASGASAVVRGQLVFQDISVASNLAQVTTLETGSTDRAMLRAGIVLNASWTAGNYSIIQLIGLTYVKFRGTLTTAGAAGSRVYAAAVGAGADNGFADVNEGAAAATIATVSTMAGRYIGVAKEAPTNGGLKLVYVNMTNIGG